MEAWDRAVDACPDALAAQFPEYVRLLNDCLAAEPAERPLFGRRSFGGFNREMEKNEASFYRAHGLRYNEPADAPKAAAALDFGAYSQGRRKDKSTNARTR